ncbi:MAG: hypothetical protein ACRBBO_15375 [Cognatishimia sp.]
MAKWNSSIPSKDNHAVFGGVAAQVNETVAKLRLPFVSNAWVERPVYDPDLPVIFALKSGVSLACSKSGFRVTHNFQIAPVEAVLQQDFIENCKVILGKVLLTRRSDLVEKAHSKEAVFSVRGRFDLGVSPLGWGGGKQVIVTGCAPGQRGERRNLHETLQVKVLFLKQLLVATMRGSARMSSGGA